jgi:hypothetical protein
MAILQLLLINRKILSVPRKQWRYSAISYGGAALAIISRCGQEMERLFGIADPREFMFIAESARPLLADYVNTSPTDQDAKKTLSNLARLIDYGKSIEDHPTIHIHGQTTSSKPTDTPQGWWAYLIGAITGAVLGGVLLTDMTMPLRLLIGVVLGRWIIGSFIASLVNPRDQDRELSGNNLFDHIRKVKWTSNASIRNAVQTTGLDDSMWQLIGIGIEAEGSLTLTFQPLGEPPNDKENEISLALRSIVGVTLPIVVSQTPRLTIALDPNFQYTIRLGDGIPMPAYFIRDGQEQIGPLQVTSEKWDDKWNVYVTPMVYNIHSATMSYYSLQGRILGKVGTTFEILKRKPIVL